MLVLTRKKSERIVIGHNITVRVLETRSGSVSIGIDAPADVPIRRAEIPPRAPRSQQALAVALTEASGR